MAWSLSEGHAAVYVPGMAGVELEFVSQLPLAEAECGLITDFAVEGAKEIYELIRKTGFNTKYRETPGGHTWANWRIHISELAPLLFR